MSTSPVVIAIEFKDEHELQESLQIAKYRFKEENEDHRYCVNRERGKEALTCLENNIPFLAYSAKDHEILYSNVLVDTLPENTKLFIRKASNRYPDKIGFDYIFCKEDEDLLLAWPKFLEKDCPYTNRSIDYIDHYNFARKIKGNSILLPSFIKTADKGKNESHTLHHVIDKDNIGLFNAEKVNSLFDFENDASQVSFLFKGQKYFNEWIGEWDRGHDATHSLMGDFILSDVMNIENDGLSDNGKIEYRCYIVRDKLVNISRYVDYKHIEVPSEAKQFAKGFIDSYSNSIASVYVLDIAKTDKGYQIVEINPMPNSGRYLNNLPLPLFNMVMKEFANNKEVENNSKPYVILKPVEPLEDEIESDFKFE